MYSLAVMMQVDDVRAEPFVHRIPLPPLGFTEPLSAKGVCLTRLRLRTLKESIKTSTKPKEGRAVSHDYLKFKFTKGRTHTFCPCPTFKAPLLLNKKSASADKDLVVIR